MIRSRQDNEKTNNFKSQHEKGSCDQGSVADNRNEVVTYFCGRNIECSRKQYSQVATWN